MESCAQKSKLSEFQSLRLRATFHTLTLFRFACKIYVRTPQKITQQWKFTFIRMLITGRWK